MYGWFGDVDSSYPIFVFVHKTIIPVSLIILPISGIAWLLWLTGKESSNLNLFSAVFWIFVGNLLVFIAMLRLSNEYRYHGHWLIDGNHYFLGSEWVPGEETGTIYSVYDCDLLIIRCKAVFREGFSMGSDEFLAINPALIVENEITKIVIDGKGVYDLR